MTFLRGKRGDRCPINNDELKVHKEIDKRWTLCNCGYCDYCKLIWITKEGNVTVKCEYDGGVE